MTETQWLIPSFGRRKLRPLGPKRKQSYQEELTAYQITDDNDYLDQIYSYDQVVLEIGFGSGEHMIAQSSALPHTGFIGSEPFVNGIDKCLRSLALHHIENIKLWPDDVRLLLPKLPKASLDRVYILFPDPWPKSKQQKRRLIQQSLLQSLFDVMKPGAMIRIATDHVEYAHYILAQLIQFDQFHWIAKQQSDWRDSPQDWVPTRYQEKAALEGRLPVFLEWQKSTTIQ